MKIKVPRKLQFLLRPKRFKITFGGRGGAKTETIARVLLVMAMQRKIKVLCCREFMTSIDDSVHATFEALIAAYDLHYFFKITNNQIEGLNGSLFRYASLSRNIGSVRSKSDYDICWIEEAENISEKSLDILIRTIRKDASEIWMSFNPDDEFGIVYRDYAKPYLETIIKTGFYEDEEIYSVRINLSDNPFAPKVLKDDSRKLKKSNLKSWLHIYGGEVFGDYKDSIIQPEWIDAAIDAHLKIEGWEPLGVKCLASDPADNGPDAKALMQRHGSVITNGEQWNDGELPEAINRTFEKVVEWQSEHLVYDSDGLGRAYKVGLNTRLEGLKIETGLSLVVTGYGGGESVDYPEEVYPKGYVQIEGGPKPKTNKETFKNKRAQYAWFLRDRFENTYNYIVKGIESDFDDMISLSSNIEDLDVLKSELVKIKRKKRTTTSSNWKARKTWTNLQTCSTP